MESGFDTASLVLFTALSPAGAVAFFLMGAYALTLGRGVSDTVWERLCHLFAVPLCVVWAGFIASATHLGTPANALHVVAGIGRSPLSNEVAAVAVFLFLAGIFWLYTFKRRHARALAQGLLAASLIGVAALLFFTSQAYAVQTVATWNTWYAPANMLLTAAFTGPALAGATLACANGTTGGTAKESEPRAQTAKEPEPRAQQAVRRPTPQPAGQPAGQARPARPAETAANPREIRWARGLLVASGAMLAVGTVVLALHKGFLAETGNNVQASALELVSWYTAAIVAHVLLATTGLGIQAHGLRYRAGSVRPSRRRLVCHEVSGCALVLGAALLVRAPFYASYLSVGF